MRVRLGQSTLGYAQSLTLGFLCFALAGFIRQQNYFIKTIHGVSESKSLFLVFDDVDHAFPDYAASAGPRHERHNDERASTIISSHHNSREDIPTPIHYCKIKNEAVAFPEVPSFIIIGAQKAGSSALADYLKLHPSIVGPSGGAGRDKELHYLDWMVPGAETRAQKQEELNISAEEDMWCSYRLGYANNFDLDLLRSNSSLVAFEKTPSYMFHSYSLPAVLKQVCPWNPKLLAILRNPIDRSWSQYNMDASSNKKLRNNLIAFEVLLDQELASLRNLGLSNASDLGHDSWDASGFAVPNLTQAVLDDAHKKHFRQVFLSNYLQRGMYAIQLRKWKEIFGSKLMVVRYEDLYGPKGQSYYHQILDHVGVPRVALPEMEDKHWSRQRYRRELSNRTREYLRLFFQPYNELLAELLGPADYERDFLWER